MKPSFGENYKFTWADLGNIESGRPNLGQDVPVTVYRLAQFTMRETLAQRFGDEMEATLLREAGWIAGREFCRNVLDVSRDFSAPRPMGRINFHVPSKRRLLYPSKSLPASRRRLT
jgi:hypothetical protein